ncbi:MAG: hypothetical protein FWD42_10865 [Solirubrobacterales bacterium]|nr:hypothetical protein [Solirubrobacterales bacterium]
MIVRISGEDQYRLDSDHEPGLHELDGEVLAALESGDESAFHAAYERLLDFVREGARVADDDLEPSDVILPPSDLSLAEAGREFTGEGLIPE